MQFEYNYKRLTLICSIEVEETDCIDHNGEHYTKESGLYVESAEHNGQDISDILAEWVIEDILEAFEKETT